MNTDAGAAYYARVTHQLSILIGHLREHPCQVNKPFCPIGLHPADPTDLTQTNFSRCEEHGTRYLPAGNLLTQLAKACTWAHDVAGVQHA